MADAIRSSGTAAALVVVLLAVALGAACGGGENGAGEAIGTEPPTGEEAVPPVQDEFQGGTFTSTQFEPQFTIQFPEGWQPSELVPGFVEFLRAGGGAVTLSSALAQTELAEAVDQMRASESLTADEPSKVTLAGNPARVFSVSTGFTIEIPGIPGYRAAPDYEIRIWAIEVDGMTVVLIADAPTDQAKEFFTEVEPVMATLRFGRP